MSQQKIIAVGGFQHETNTFAPHLATWEAFERADSWPALTTGEALFATMDGLNIPLPGFIERARQDGHRLLPLCWCSAEPSSFVTREAFERVAEIICAPLRAARHLDAVYLDLHGAMVAEHFEDGEGELLRRVRAIVGPSMPVVMSLDLHANVTRGMLEHCDAMTIYRSYPHLDMAATGARAYDLLLPLLAGRKLYKVMRKLPFLLALTSQCTDFDPCRSIYAQLPQAGAASGVGSVDFAAGFPPSDIDECGPAVVAYGADEAAVEAAAEQVCQQILAAEAEFHVELLDADTAVLRAMANASDKPVVLADAQDNPGAGGTADSTGLLAALVRNRAQQAIIAMLYDPEIAELAQQAGIGAEFDAALGGKSGAQGIEPYHGRFRVEALGDGNFIFTGAMNLNSQARLGNMALLRVVDELSEVRVVVGSSRSQCLDQAMIRHVGVEPSAQRIVAVKSSVHFRADFDPIAAETLVVIAPGVNYCKFDDLHYRNLRAGVRLGPLGPVHGHQG
jgi:microcystin degradation protein MlrC